MSNTLHLHTYFRSSAAYRVRIVLHLKGLDFKPEYVHLLRNGGENYSKEYLSINPQALVPALVVSKSNDEPYILGQSLAMIEYLEDKYPEPSIFPSGVEEKNFVRSLALMISCDIHPLNNLRVLEYLKKTFSADEEQVADWYRHWIAEGFVAIEETLRLRGSGDSSFCLGNTVTIADVCLIPQVYNAFRFSVDMNKFHRIQKIYEHCMTLDSFINASPEKQADAE